MQVSPETIEKAAEVLRRGGLVVFPTETVYGLAADATNEPAVLRIFEVKGRPVGNPLPVQVASVDDVRSLVKSIPASAVRMMQDFFPGPLTIVFEAGEGVSPLITAGTGKIGVRMPDHDAALDMIREFGGPIIATSANLSGQNAPVTAEEAIENLGGGVDFVVDAGPARIKMSSTVVDVTTDPPGILRKGSVSEKDLEKYFRV